MKRYTFLLSSIGGVLAQNVARCIRDGFPSARIVGMDIHTQHAGTLFVDEFMLTESATSKTYLESLQKIVKESSADFFLPLNEAELYRLSKTPEEELKAVLGRTELVWSGLNCLNLFLDKRTTVEFLASIGVQTPKTYPLSNLQLDNFPLVVKPSKGSGSRGVFIVKNRREFDAAITLVQNPMVQQYIPAAESEFTAGVFARKGYEARVVVFRRILSSGGGTSWCESVFDAEIVDTCRRIAEKIELNGSINVQLRKFNGQPYIFEVNARFSSTVHIRSKLGFRDVLWSIDSSQPYLGFDPHASINRIYTVYQSNESLK